MSVAYTLAERAARRASDAAADAATALSEGRVDTASNLLDEAAGNIRRAQVNVQEVRDA